MHAGRQPVLVRAVNALMRAVGGAEVTLRVAASAPSGLERELGISAATPEEVTLAPVVVRSLAVKDGRESVEVLVSRSALERNGRDPGEVVKAATEVVHRGKVFYVTSVTAERFAGIEYMYRLTAVASG